MLLHQLFQIQAGLPLFTVLKFGLRLHPAELRLIWQCNAHPSETVQVPGSVPVSCFCTLQLVAEVADGFRAEWIDH